MTPNPQVRQGGEAPSEFELWWCETCGEPSLEWCNPCQTCGNPVRKWPMVAQAERERMLDLLADLMKDDVGVDLVCRARPSPRTREAPVTTSQEAKAGMRDGQKPPPTVGERYRFTDFVGASFEATFAGHETCEGNLVLHFEDRGDFETNRPINYEPVSS